MFPRTLIYSILLLVVVSPAWAMDDETGVHCLMGEARGESYECQVATAEVIRNRNSTRGVYGCQAKINEPEWVWDRARKAWKESATTNLSKGATHFESTDFPKPYWANEMQEVAHIGKHKFYKKGN